MSTSQRSESMNKFFKDYLNSSTPVSVFVLQYDKAIDARYDKVTEKNYKTKYSRPVLKTLYPMEDEVAKKYTRKIFQIFQEELIQSQKFVSEKFEVKDGINVYKVHQLQRQKPTYMVSLNFALKKAVCSCHKFEFMGILCRHVLMIFIKKQILSLPVHYLLDRWTRNATKEKAIDHPSEITNVKPSTLWFNNIMMHSLGLAEQATRSEKHYLFTHQRLLQLCRELDELPYEFEEDCVPNDQVGEKYCEMNQVGEKDCEMKSCEQSQDVTLFDPPVVITKGRPESLRKKYALEVAQKAKKVSSQKNKKFLLRKFKKFPLRSQKGEQKI
ncbi:protein FAR1-RELATED SEQUENCE 9-like [Capsicum annuum]